MAAVITLLSGCSGFSLTIENMLAPPKLTDEQAEIYAALLSGKGGSIDLSYPKSGVYRSAFVLVNLDDEPTDEALVFYRTDGSANESTLRINFLDQKDGSWQSVYDMSASGTEVESVAFEKLSGDSGINIIISYSVLSQTDRAMSVLRYSDGIPSEVFRGSYVYFELLDAGRDGLNEIFLINYNSALGYCSASLLGWSGGKFTALSSVPLHKEAVSFLKTTVTETENDETALFIEYGKGDNSYGTEILRCYGNNLTAMSFTDEELTRRVNTFTPMLFCSDIDGDGTLEIPTTTPSLGYENLTKPEQLYQTVWYQFKDNELEQEYVTFVSIKNDYIFKIPSRWQGFVTVSVNGDEVSFSEYTDSGEVLLSVLTAEKGTDPGGAWTLYDSAASDEYNYYVMCGASENPMLLTDAELRDCFLFV